MKVNFIIHEDFEAPGAYESWAISRNHEITYTRLYAGDDLPDSTNELDILIVMGGPQSPETTSEECPHFSADKEKIIILDAIRNGKVVIGVCLGSQLIGEALGAKYEHSPEREIGNFSIFLTEYGQCNSKFSHFGSVILVGHWHNDMPGLTQDAKIIAHSEGCPRQIIEYADLVYGFQCHMELTREVIELLIKNSDDLKDYTSYKFVDSPEKLLAHDYKEMNDKLYEFLDKLLKDYTKSTK
mmetsp:Transcript_8113/g.10187  ORF Transcript_8113/g.10187 Transcript_8113/m.10187 type:complete len:241 (-) Transcript_8113:583-1305(-)